jgi:hypothetical protein
MRQLTRSMAAVASAPPAQEIQAMVARAALAGAYAHARGHKHGRGRVQRQMPASGVPKLDMRAAKAAQREKVRAERIAALVAKRSQELSAGP